MSLFFAVLCYYINKNVMNQGFEGDEGESVVFDLIEKCRKLC